MMDQIFRQYDIRAKIGPELLIEEVYGLTRVIAAYLMRRQPALRCVAVGADGRIHSPAIKEEVCRALQDAGLEVIFIGTCPTPVLYFALHTLDVGAGLMITASHNGKEYNGIKICLGRDSVWGREIQDILHWYKRGEIPGGKSKGVLYHEISLIRTYIDFLKDKFSDLVGLESSYVIDCGNGAAGTVLPLLIQRFAWQDVSLLYADVDGTYPHHEADPTVAHNMADLKKIVTTTHISCGIGLDGDCDRMAPMTKQGFLVPGDMVLTLFAQDVLKNNPGAPIVFDIKCSAMVKKLIKQWGGVPIESASGHSIIKSKMRSTGALLAGELSCHFFFKDAYFGYDDGIYALLRLMRLIKNSGCSLDELVAQLPTMYAVPEIRLACQEDEKVTIVDGVKRLVKEYHSEAEISTIDGVRVVLPIGWFIIRASNTQSVMCVRCEAESLENLDTLKNFLINVLKHFFSVEVLKGELGL